MKSRSFEELIAGDPRSRRFSPFGGLDTERIYHPSVTADLFQRAMVRIQLVSGVADVVRQRFEVAQLLHIYSAFAYQFFGVAVTEAHLLYETALGARFVETYEGKIPLVRRRNGDTVVFEATQFSDLHETFRRGPYRYWARAKHHDGWFIEGMPDFDCSLPALLRWAYAAGLLSTWLDGRWEQSYPPTRVMAQTSEQHLLPKGYWGLNEEERDTWWHVERRAASDREEIEAVAAFRNYLAHPHHSGLTLPGDSRSSIAEVADFVNSLWTNKAAPPPPSQAPPIGAWLDHVLADVRQALVQRFVWKAVKVLVAGNASIQEDDTFYRWMDEVYANAVAAAVRRQIDRRTDTISLLRLLEALGTHRYLVSRDRHVRLFMEGTPPAAESRPYEQEVWRHAANESYDRLAGVGQTHYDPAADIARLIEVTAPIKQYVNEHVAHSAERGRESATTYVQLDRALDLLDELMRKAHVLITCADLLRVVPQWQYDWQTVFDKPWRTESHGRRRDVVG